jgi:tRNA(Arg) A34 adenosine deaminase TadA
MRQAITAIIYDKKGRVLSIGQNNYLKSHPLQAHHADAVGEPYKIFLHSEIHAITRCPDISKAYRISVFRYGKDGRPMLAAPCPICRSAIAATPIKIIEHTVG